jgi:eukaryotic-like serine/threonine-protein kinase
LPKRQTQPLTSLRPSDEVNFATAELPEPFSSPSPGKSYLLEEDEATREVPRLADGQDSGGRVCPRCSNRYSQQQRFCPFDGQALRHASWHPQHDPLVGVLVAERYQVEELLAEGGMGKVYLVRHVTLGSHFAMKVLRSDLARDPDVVQRLRAEARAMAGIEHPNIVDVSDMGEIDGSVMPELGDRKLPYFVMEHAPGCSLGERIREQGPLGSIEAIEVVRDVAFALAAAHDANVIHRDIKPDNIRVSGHGEQLRAKVLDFGVAKVIGASRRTMPGIVFGTPYYMSPEQGSGLPVDARSDIYSLGVVLFECLTGRVPFVGDSFVGVVTQHRTQPPPLLREYRAELDGHPLQRIVERCLNKTPELRYQDCHHLEEALRVALGALRSVPPAAEEETEVLPLPEVDLRDSEIALPTHSWGGKRWLALASLIAAVVAIAVALRSSQEEPPPKGAAPVAEAPRVEAAPKASGADAQVTEKSVAATPAAPPTPEAPVGRKSAPAVPRATSRTRAPKPRARAAAAAPQVSPKTVPKKPKPAAAGDVVDPWN